MRQCNVLGIVKYDLRLMIKGSSHYSVMGIYYPSENSKLYIDNEKSLLLPAIKHSIEENVTMLADPVPQRLKVSVQGKNV